MIDFNEVSKITIDLASLDNYLGLATTNPFLFLLIGMIVVDIITGLGATLVSRQGLDSSIAFKGWVKHSVILSTCLIVETIAIALNIAIIGNIVTFLAMTVYFSSIPGNLSACGIKLPKFVQKLFKAEIERKYRIYLESKDNQGDI